MAVKEKTEQQELRTYVESTLIKELHAKTFRLLSDDEAKILALLIVQKDSDFEEMLSEKSIQNQVDIYLFLKQVLTMRANKLGLTLHAKVIYMLMVLTLGNVGKCLVYLYYMAWKVKKNGLSGTIDIDTFGMKLFPSGVISDHAMSSAWDAQKINADAFEGHLTSDNAIDYRELYESLIHEQEEA